MKVDIKKDSAIAGIMVIRLEKIPAHVEFYVRQGDANELTPLRSEEKRNGN